MALSVVFDFFSKYIDFTSAFVVLEFCASSTQADNAKVVRHVKKC